MNVQLNYEKEPTTIWTCLQPLLEQINQIMEILQWKMHTIF
jgi:hypothetical protein